MALLSSLFFLTWNLCAWADDVVTAEKQTRCLSYCIDYNKNATVRSKVGALELLLCCVLLADGYLVPSCTRLLRTIVLRAVVLPRIHSTADSQQEVIRNSVVCRLVVT